jgi:hypothetical protein
MHRGHPQPTTIKRTSAPAAPAFKLALVEIKMNGPLKNKSAQKECNLTKRNLICNICLKNIYKCLRNQDKIRD